VNEVTFQTVVDGEQLIRPPAGVALPQGACEVTIRPVETGATPGRDAANARLRQQRVSLGHPTGTENEAIDADLAHAFGKEAKAR